MGANAFDIILIVLFAWSAYRGFVKGIILSAASLLALLLGVWGAIKFSAVTGGFLADFIHVETRILQVIAFAVTFIGIVIAIHFIAKAIEGIANAVALGVVNKVFGAAFGVLKSAFIISVVLYIINVANVNLGFISTEFKEKSLFYSPVSKFAPVLFKKLNVDQLKDNDEQAGESVDV